MHNQITPAFEDVSLPFSPGSIRQIMGDEPTRHRDALLQKFSSIIEVNHSLTRQLVSYQANKAAPGLRWLKYREGFSTSLLNHLFDYAGWQHNARILDPFSGIGTTALVASLRGEGTAIELMPIGIAVTKAIATLSKMSASTLRDLTLKVDKCFSKQAKKKFFYRHVAITLGAFDATTEKQIANYRELEFNCDPHTRDVLRTIALSVLEDVSFTRKDGQYLRWDARSGRQKAQLDKGPVSDFALAVHERLVQMSEDLPHMRTVCEPKNINLIEGSSLERLQMLPAAYFDGVVTSPPYANRYDYTRTYALELAYCDYASDDIKNLRQSLLSATVENRSKVASLTENYQALGRALDLDKIMQIVERNAALGEVIRCLQLAADRGDLSNKNVIGLVKNYFLEMAVVVAELSRVMKSGGHVFMVNDNVQYAGEEVPVDLILCAIAAQSGFSIEKIWKLAKGKGNASQQMGKYGRREIRKCVYVWRKS